MFDVSIVHLIEGTNVDRPCDAITLTLEIHKHFGNFDIFFERVVDNNTPDTYDVPAFHPFIAAHLRFPARRTFFIHPFIDPPSERLLKLHSAFGYVLHLSGAEGYIDCILENMDHGVVREDGSTQLGALASVALQIRG
ncbi:hypothetical protein QBC36DRAFT_312770 [Triangularia setosa]|uniref:Uncharacterized protein n=1 Tax=Triangularia setosa TaxID=2587417 RepID=A0AAN6W3U0_9PEZI|nr:hypothetical protein QBC36DRAFT_312770 [Podospora setosa]